MKKQEIPTPHPGHQAASASITAALGMLSYPLEKSTAIQKVGDWKVPIGDGKVALAQILEGIPHEMFTDVSQATSAVDQHWGTISETLAGMREHVEQEQKAIKKRR